MSLHIKHELLDSIINNNSSKIKINYLKIIFEILLCNSRILKNVEHKIADTFLYNIN